MKKKTKTETKIVTARFDRRLDGYAVQVEGESTESAESALTLKDAKMNPDGTVTGELVQAGVIAPDDTKLKHQHDIRLTEACTWVLQEAKDRIVREGKFLQLTGYGSGTVFASKSLITA